MTTSYKDHIKNITREEANDGHFVSKFLLGLNDEVPKPLYNEELLNVIRTLDHDFDAFDAFERDLIAMKPDVSGVPGMGERFMALTRLGRVMMWSRITRDCVDLVEGRRT